MASVRLLPHVALLSAVAGVALVPTLAASQQPPARIVAIGDVHGAYDGFTTILRRSGLVNDQLKWSGGRSTLVQTGDYTDRGTDVRQVLDLLMRLEREARAAGGQVIALAGNHEMMNAMGDLRDVTPEICATFATAKSEARREQAWTQYQRLAASRAGVVEPAPAPAPAVYSLTRDAFMAAHPPGCLEYRDAMAPDGVYGRWIRSRDIAAVVGTTLFMHAGINPARPLPRTVREINERARDEVKRFDSLRKRLTDRRLALPFFNLQEIIDVAVVELTLATRALETAKAEGTEPPRLDLPLLREAQGVLDIAKWSLVDPEGPLWFRGYANWDEAATAPQVAALLDQLKLSRIVVGHTPTPDRRVVVRYDGRVLIIDTGMLTSYYKGQPAAIEMAGERVKAIYPDGEVELIPAKAA